MRPTWQIDEGTAHYLGWRTNRLCGMPTFVPGPASDSITNERNTQGTPMNKHTRRTVLRSAASTGLFVFTSSLSTISKPSNTMDHSRFTASIDRTVMLPSADGYDRARRVASFNPHTDKRPAMIVSCANATDVARSIDFARRRSLPIAVRSGGHDVMGQSTRASELRD